MKRTRPSHGFGTMLLASTIVLAASSTSARSPTELSAPNRPALVEVAAAVGLEFRHWNGMTGELLFPEMTGQGCAFLDYDGDGDLDIYLLQGARFKGAKKPPLTPPPEGPLIDRLYRNDGPGADGTPRFTDVTKTSELTADGYGMGVATGDIDNDGDVDLFVANFGPDQLWRNDGDGTFSNITNKAGERLTGNRWTSGATFFDYDRDGWLDLFVINYVRYRVADDVACYAKTSRRDYCGPSTFAGEPNQLWRNQGDGTFVDVTHQAGLRHDGPSLGVVAADVDGNGWPDLFVADDGQPNKLWLNQGKNGGGGGGGGGEVRFVDDGLLAGVAVNRRGEPEASMGVDAGDIDNDGDLDLFASHLTGETNTLYVNGTGGLFEDRTVEMGLANSSLPLTAFGTAFFDLDNDGWLDLLVVNGAVKILDDQSAAGQALPLAQSDQLFINQAGRRFVEASQRAPALQPPTVSRGVAVGDIDNDGDADLLISDNHGPPRLLINRVGQEAPWLAVRAVVASAKSQRDDLGAVVELVLSDGSSLVRRVGTDGSYASARDPRALFGLGRLSAKTVRIRWSDGSLETWPATPAGTYTTLTRGSGKTQENDR